MVDSFCNYCVIKDVVPILKHCFHKLSLGENATPWQCCYTISFINKVHVMMYETEIWYVDLTYEFIFFIFRVLHACFLAFS